MWARHGLTLATNKAAGANEQLAINARDAAEFPDRSRPPGLGTRSDGGACVSVCLPVCLPASLPACLPD
jgi:hypothetical protein